MIELSRAGAAAPQTKFEASARFMGPDSTFITQRLPDRQAEPAYFYGELAPSTT